MADDPTTGVGTTLAELHLGPVVTVSEHDSLADVARRMEAEGVSCVLVEEPPLRVLSEHDLALAWMRHAESLGAADVASLRPYWVRSTARLVEAAGLMVDLGVRHLVVVDVEDRAVGLVSMPEVLSALLGCQDPALVYASFAAVLRRTR